MQRNVIAAGLVLLLGTLAFGQENPDLQSALALQRVMQQTIRDVEPAIACILVSRSDLYAAFGQARDETPGKLGRFTPDHFSGQPDQLKRLDLENPQVIPEAFGSGVVIDAKGLVLTNYHVVRGATKVFVRLPGGKGSYADIHAGDWRSDLAVLRMLEPPPNLKVVRFGGGGKVERGEFVLSIANPFAAGFRDGQPSASWGIISNIRRRSPNVSSELEPIKALHYYSTLLQIDARLNLGCSGGALVNLRGEMIGLTSAMAGIQGGETPGGFALPLDDSMLRIVNVLKRGEEVEYGFLGVSFQPKAIPLDEGVRLDNVIRGSPADVDARLNEGDTILAVNGTPVREHDDLFLELGKQLAGTKVKLQVRRSGVPAPRAEEVSVTLAKFYVPGDRIASSTGARPFFRGLRVDHTSLLVQQAKDVHASIPTGVMISEIRAKTSAATAQLKQGDVITHINNQPVTSPPSFYQIVAGLAGPAELTLANQRETVTLR